MPKKDIAPKQPHPGRSSYPDTGKLDKKGVAQSMPTHQAPLSHTRHETTSSTSVTPRHTDSSPLPGARTISPGTSIQNPNGGSRASSPRSDTTPATHSSDDTSEEDEATRESSQRAMSRDRVSSDF